MIFDSVLKSIALVQRAPVTLGYNGRVQYQRWDRWIVDLRWRLRWRLRSRLSALQPCSVQCSPILTAKSNYILAKCIQSFSYSFFGKNGTNIFNYWSLVAQDNNIIIDSMFLKKKYWRARDTGESMCDFFPKTIKGWNQTTFYCYPFDKILVFVRLI